MAELFIELFSEEIPAKLQIDARQKIRENIEAELRKINVHFEKWHMNSKFIDCIII